MGDPTDPGIPDLPWHLCELTGEERARMADVLRKHEGIFSYEARPILGRIKATEFSIDTGDAKPVKARDRRVVNQRKLDDMRKEIDKMLEMGVIEPIYNSEWSSAVVMVMKSDGTWRFCVDYRPVNELTKPDLYPTPRMEDLINTMAKAKYKSSIDLNCGFWQIPVRPEDMEKTTFICPFGTFAHKRMPFGARNTPATFQRAMDSILDGLQWKRAPTYVDNVGIWTPPDEDHVKVVDEVLTRFGEAGATLKASKCEIGRQEISYLGLNVGKDGIFLAEDRIEAIKAYPEPKTSKQLHRFLGMASWCRRFIKDFGSISAPLYDLLKSKADFAMDASQRAAFEQLKACMSQVGVMKIFEFGKELVVRTDASAQGVGAVLLQKDDEGNLRVIEYASKKANKMTARYSAEKMEAFAVIWAVRRWHEYLLGSHFTIETDNRALKWMFGQKNLSGVIARWVMTMNQYDYEVRHKPGKFNRVADALSRSFPQTPEDKLCTAEDLAKAALEDVYVPMTPTHLEEPNERRRKPRGRIPLPTGMQPQKDAERATSDGTAGHCSSPAGDQRIDRQARSQAVASSDNTRSAVPSEGGAMEGVMNPPDAFHADGHPSAMESRNDEPDCDEQPLASPVTERARDVSAFEEMERAAARMLAVADRWNPHERGIVMRNLRAVVRALTRRSMRKVDEHRQPRVANRAGGGSEWESDPNDSSPGCDAVTERDGPTADSPLGGADPVEPAGQAVTAGTDADDALWEPSSGEDVVAQGNRHPPQREESMEAQSPRRDRGANRREGSVESVDVRKDKPLRSRASGAQKDAVSAEDIDQVAGPSTAPDPRWRSQREHRSKTFDPAEWDTRQPGGDSLALEGLGESGAEQEKDLLPVVNRHSRLARDRIRSVVDMGILHGKRKTVDQESTVTTSVVSCPSEGSIEMESWQLSRRSN
jgi:hypothetical protein